ncbi:type I-E CRISPR-associated protein Cse2/CasB [Streptomyces collinus]|uniref:type I-E CRISPR-associated protein Cse2/CasB n=1 Tax=Streptomyces collinus TaxID=42684 RepID=UPI0036AF731A
MPTSAMPPTHDQGEARASDRFVAHVMRLCEDSRTRSDLRTGLGLPVERCNRMHRYLARRLSEGLHRDARRAYYGVAALIAAQPPHVYRSSAQQADCQLQEPLLQRRERSNLGASLAGGVNGGILRPGTAESHLHLFSRQSSDALHERLPALTRHLLDGGVNVDWGVLLEDLTWWNRSRDVRVTRWMETYYRAVNEETDDVDDKAKEGINVQPIENAYSTEEI